MESVGVVAEGAVVHYSEREVLFVSLTLAIGLYSLAEADQSSVSCLFRTD